MIGSTRALKVFAWPKPADLRMGYDGLHGLVTNGLHRDVLAGDCFLFVNCSRNRCKVLMWDGTGLCIYMKRLERGRFAPLWRSDAGGEIELTLSELALFIEGSSLVGKKPLSPPKYSPRPLVIF
jgi:transposase